MWEDLADSTSSTSASTASKTYCNQIPLPIEFRPTSADIIVGTGREPQLHEGNVRFQGTLENYIAQYSQATSKQDKTRIISHIVKQVKSESSTGAGFVNKVDGRWYVVDELTTREKVSQGLRNILHCQYRSSQKSKKRRREVVCKEMDMSIGNIMQAKQNFLTDRIEKLSEEMKVKCKIASDEEVFTMFTKANIDILEGLKKNASLRNRMESRFALLSFLSSSTEEQDVEEDPEPDMKRNHKKHPGNKHR